MTHRLAASTPLAEILTGLEVPRDGVVYVHASADWLGRVGIRLADALDGLLAWAGDDGTLVLPAFPFRGSHEAYLRGRPTFDVRRTPIRVGLLNETLRRRPGARRSLDPDLSVLALGPQAGAVIGDGFTGEDPTGADSPFQRVIDLAATLVGLGVSRNTMGMIHVLDSRYRSGYPFEIMSDAVYPTNVIDAVGAVHHVVKRAMRDELVDHIRPSRILSTLEPGTDVFRSLKVGDTDFFRWDLPRWERLCVRHLEERLATGRQPCWLDEVSEHLPHRDR